VLSSKYVGSDLVSAKKALKGSLAVFRENSRIGRIELRRALPSLDGGLVVTSQASKDSDSSRNVVSLGFVSLFTDVSSEMTFGVLPTFFYEQLGIPRALIGIIEGIAEATSYIFRMLSGLISDRIGKRKVVVFAGYALSSAVKPLFAFTSTWFDALTIRFGDRVGKGVRTSPRDALLASSIPERHLGRAFGLHRTLDQSGAVIGPLLALLLIPLITVRGSS